MISHSGPTGLQCPVRYEVIAMENMKSFDPKELYDLTYNLSYGFYNYQASIKLPAPLMYSQCLVNQISKKCGSHKDFEQTPTSFQDTLYCI